MKKIIKLIAIIAVSISLIAATVGAYHLYTKTQVINMAHKVADVRWNEGTPNPIHLGNLLYANIHTNIDKKPYFITKDRDTIWWGLSKDYAGMYTPKTYKTGWRTALANNPNLAYTALKMYGKIVIKTIKHDIVKAHQKEISPDARWNVCNIISPKSAIEEWRIDSAKTATKLANFSIDKYWENEKKIIDKYQLLIENLLKLSDPKLNEFINEIGGEQEYCDCNNGRTAIKTQKWLLSKELIKKIHSSSYDIYGESPWYLMVYPVDLLLLTYRVSKDYSKWTPRTFLTEVLKFSKEIERFL